MENENKNKTSYENLINIKRKIDSDICEKIRGIDLSSAVIIVGTGFRTYDDGDYSVTARVAQYVGNGNNSVEVTCYAHDDYEYNKAKAAFFLNQMAAFFDYVKKISKNSNER